MSEQFGRSTLEDWESVRVQENRELTEAIQRVLAQVPPDYDLPWGAPLPPASVFERVMGRVRAGILTGITLQPWDTLPAVRDDR